MESGGARRGLGDGGALVRAAVSQRQRRFVCSLCVNSRDSACVSSYPARYRCLSVEIFGYLPLTYADMLVISRGMSDMSRQQVRTLS